MLNTRLRITAYERRHRRALLDLIWSSPWTHKHLDWYKTSSWIDRDDAHVALAWDDDQLVGYLGLSPPFESHCWIRLLGISSGNMPGAIIRDLWQCAEAHCRQSGVSTVLMLMASNWCFNYISSLGFSYLDDIITLNHIGPAMPSALPSAVHVYAAEAEHVYDIARIDRQAFQPPWYLTLEDLRQALRVAVLAAVAEIAGEIVGYQICTRNEEMIHLARLAVAPELQGKGIGAALLTHALGHARGRGIDTMSVNTQLSNLPSQRLYQRRGFVRNGLDYEVWRKQLDQPLLRQSRSPAENGGLSAKDRDAR